MAAKKKESVKSEVLEEGVVSEKVKAKENSTLIWVFVMIVIVFAAVLVPYFWNASSKVFEFGGIDWVVEEYDYLEIFHGRFVSLTDANLNYNIYLRVDPRKNDAEVVGKLDDFSYGGYISWDEEVEACRGDLPRTMLDLTAFLKQGVGVGVVSGAASDEEFANASGMEFVDCETTDRTVVLIEIGEDRGIAQDEENPSCYVITVEDCEDFAVLERFMVKSVIDFRDSYGSLDSEE